MVKSKRINKTFSKDGDFAKYLTYVNDAIIQVNSKGIIEAWLGSASKIFGFTEKSMLGKHISTIISEYERERNEIIKYMLTNRTLSGYETQLMNKNGTDIYCSVTLIPAKKRRSYLLIISDISEQRSFHDRYYSLQKLHNEVIDNIAVGLMIVDRETHEVVYSNKTAMNLLQLSSKEIIGRKFWDFVLPEMVKTAENVFTSQEEFFATGPIEFKFEKYHDKKPFWAELYISRLNYHRRPCILITFKDTTNQKEYVTNLEKSIKEKDLLTTTKSRFMANMSHELRSPINIILGYVDILAGFEDLQGESREFLTYIQKSAEHLLKTLNDILDLSKAEASKIKLIEKPYNLVALIKSVLSLIEVKLIGKKIALDYNSTIEPDAYFNIDAHNLQRVLLNILDNAVKFTDEGLISVDVRYKNNTLIFTVSDTGIGMTQEEVDRLFIPFEQAHYEISQRYGGT
ncbi:MAG: PAS domain-containing sensor histidine kinase, partial [Ignavibacteria bacterium]|nr:PAS domain-containing sensor histidine kinase [Ignavibacteria bacterium]